MAGKKKFYSSMLLVVLVLANEYLSSQGRYLKAEKFKSGGCRECAERGDSNIQGTASSMISNTIEGHDDRVLMVAIDGRPTEPGHSPGVGHAIKTRSGDKNK